MRAIIVVFALLGLCAIRVDGGTLNSLDLASLHREAELIVLVEDFQPAEQHRVGHGIVRKVFKGDYDLGTEIRLIPWGVDFGRVTGVPGGKLKPGFAAVFFLKRPSLHRCWETVFSGTRVIVEDRVFGVRPAGSYTYRILPATPELLEDATPYGQERLERDLFEAADRVHAVEEALLLRPTTDNLEEFDAVLETEMRRSFPAATRSDLIIEMAERLAEHGDQERLWKLRTRVPRASMGRELDRFVAGLCDFDFVKRGLDAPGSAEFNAMLGFLDAASSWIRNEVKLKTLEHLLELGASFNERIGTPSQLQRIYQTVSLLFDKTAEPLSPKLIADLLELTKAGGPLAAYYLGPVVIRRRPLLASRQVDQVALRTFALVEPQETKRKRLKGQVRFRRLTSSYTLQNPTIIFQRRSAGGQTLDHFAHSIGLPARALQAGASGEYTTGFSWDFTRRPLASGAWRMFLKLNVIDGDHQQTWTTTPVKFRIRY